MAIIRTCNCMTTSCSICIWKILDIPNTNEADHEQEQIERLRDFDLREQGPINSPEEESSDEDSDQSDFDELDSVNDSTYDDEYPVAVDIDGYPEF